MQAPGNKTNASGRNADRESFFFFFAWFLLFFVVASFGAKAVFDTDDLPPLTVLHHFHAVAMLSWFGLFALQPTLVQQGRIDAHRLLGKLSPIVVIGFIGLAIPITLLNWGRIGDPLLVTANGVNLVLFVALYSSAIAWRRDAAAHKRLMTYATLMLMGPAAGRIPELFDQSHMLSVPIILALQLTPLVHDIVVRRRVHPATWIGMALVLAAVVLILGLSGSESWAAFLERALGPRGRAST